MWCIYPILIKGGYHFKQWITFVFMYCNSKILVVILLMLHSGCKQGDNASSDQKLPTEDPNSPASIVRIPLDQEGKPDTSELAQITFDETTFDFGTVKEGDIVEHAFHFTNTGKVGLIIYEAKSSCGCTVPEIPRELVAPGEKNKIVAKFNTTGKPGDQIKTITVYSNTIPSQTVLSLNGKVHSKS